MDAEYDSKSCIFHLIEGLLLMRLFIYFQLMIFLTRGGEE